MLWTGYTPSQEARAKPARPSAQDPLKVQCKYLGGECLNRFKVEVVIQVQIVEVLILLTPRMKIITNICVVL